MKVKKAAYEALMEEHDREIEEMKKEKESVNVEMQKEYLMSRVMELMEYPDEKEDHESLCAELKKRENDIENKIKKNEEIIDALRELKNRNS